MITRSQKEFGKKTHDEMPQIRRNLDPELHPFATEIEFTRALNASKMEKVGGGDARRAVVASRWPAFCRAGAAVA